jgi:GDP/UDP-N,N'-diacetylbacillosamine 2-epimerase (hydrolysing)
MGRFRMKIGILTSSRADYGIYLPLLKKMKEDSDIDLSIIAFGTHLKTNFGSTIKQIEKDGFLVDHRIDNLKFGDSPKDIALNYAFTANLFAELWGKVDYDFVLCLGDRFEMAAAVTAGIPFGIKFAHIHAGETSKGAIDNIYRDQISLASSLHFVAIKAFVTRIKNLINKTNTAFYCGAIGLENINNLDLLTCEAFLNKWHINLNEPTILVTVHPETIEHESNLKHAEVLYSSLNKILERNQVLVTMPNADTYGSVYRKMFKRLKNSNSQSLFLVENLGTQSYFTAMKFCKLLIGNTSSGIIEAASFGKYVVNLGNRQEGRTCGENVIHVPFEHNSIISAALKYKNATYNGANVYEMDNGSTLIIETLKNKMNGLS